MGLDRVGRESKCHYPQNSGALHEGGKAEGKSDEVPFSKPARNSENTGTYCNQSGTLPRKIVRSQ